jgi:hypothetical protein
VSPREFELEMGSNPVKSTLNRPPFDSPADIKDLLDRRLSRGQLHSHHLTQPVLLGSSFLGLPQAVSELLGR